MVLGNFRWSGRWLSSGIRRQLVWLKCRDVSEESAVAVITVHNYRENGSSRFWFGWVYSAPKQWAACYWLLCGELYNCWKWGVKGAFLTLTLTRSTSSVKNGGFVTDAQCSIETIRELCTHHFINTKLSLYTFSGNLRKVTLSFIVSFGSALCFKLSNIDLLNLFCRVGNFGKICSARE
jgi:hypothetical protein